MGKVLILSMIYISYSCNESSNSKNMMPSNNDFKPDSESFINGRLRGKTKYSNNNTSNQFSSPQKINKTYGLESMGYINHSKSAPNSPREPLPNMPNSPLNTRSNTSIALLNTPDSPKSPSLIGNSQLIKFYNKPLQKRTAQPLEKSISFDPCYTKHKQKSKKNHPYSKRNQTMHNSTLIKKKSNSGNQQYTYNQINVYSNTNSPSLNVGMSPTMLSEPINPSLGSPRSPSLNVSVKQSKRSRSYLAKSLSMNEIVPNVFTNKELTHRRNNTETSNPYPYPYPYPLEHFALQDIPLLERPNLTSRNKSKSLERVYNSSLTTEHGDAFNDLEEEEEQQQDNIFNKLRDVQKLIYAETHFPITNRQSQKYNTYYYNDNSIENEHLRYDLPETSPEEKEKECFPEFYKYPYFNIPIPEYSRLSSQSPKYPQSPQPYQQPQSYRRPQSYRYPQSPQSYQQPQSPQQPQSYRYPQSPQSYQQPQSPQPYQQPKSYRYPLSPQAYQTDKFSRFPSKLKSSKNLNKIPESPYTSEQKIFIAKAIPFGKNNLNILSEKQYFENKNIFFWKKYINLIVEKFKNNKKNNYDEKKTNDDKVNKNRKICVLLGLEGTGKTTLSNIYAIQTLKKRYKHIWKIDGERENYIKNSIVEICNALDYRQYSYLPSDMERLFFLKEKLNNHPDWLLIIDNAENIKSINHFIPEKGGDILVTSQNINESWNKLGETIYIDEWTKQESLELLTSFHNPCNEFEMKSAKKIIKEIGCLPIFINLVGLCIKQQVSGPLNLKLTPFLTFFNNLLVEKNKLKSKTTMRNTTSEVNTSKMIYNTMSPGFRNSFTTDQCILENKKEKEDVNLSSSFFAETIDEEKINSRSIIFQLIMNELRNTKNMSQLIDVIQILGYLKEPFQYFFESKHPKFASLKEFKRRTSKLKNINFDWDSYLSEKLNILDKYGLISIENIMNDPSRSVSLTMQGRFDMESFLEEKKDLEIKEKSKRKIVVHPSIQRLLRNWTKNKGKIDIIQKKIMQMLEHSNMCNHSQEIKSQIYSTIQYLQNNQQLHVRLLYLDCITSNDDVYQKKLYLYPYCTNNQLLHKQVIEFIYNNKKKSFLLLRGNAGLGKSSYACYLTQKICKDYWKDSKYNIKFIPILVSLDKIDKGYNSNNVISEELLLKGFGINVINSMRQSSKKGKESFLIILDGCNKMNENFYKKYGLEKWNGKNTKFIITCRNSYLENINIKKKIFPKYDNFFIELNLKPFDHNQICNYMNKFINLELDKEYSFKYYKKKFSNITGLEKILGIPLVLLLSLNIFSKKLANGDNVSEIKFHKIFWEQWTQRETFKNKNFLISNFKKQFMAFCKELEIDNKMDNIFVNLIKQQNKNHRFNDLI